ncbi:PilZ domain-containing protein [Gallaecimonas pentaromativorans]|uniref:PilZ domain-containing protein n=1 Tax=Gallaecimonas pentaromativorans TaxID=584787 RepID=A0A3N1PL43_9GAMM|nr:PilZ domain-containing protein [Gallaecimonas pentaromativorans]ROQ27610.1 PilZ domain-containing protein [Gallaecimonas pentaromativorans]
MIRAEDLRRERRMEINSPVEIIVQDAHLAGHCSNLSGNGMGVMLDEPLAEGTQVQVKIEGGMDRLPPFMADAVVIRCEAKDPGFEVGLSFSN